MFNSKIKSTLVLLYALSMININGCSKTIKPINNHELPENTVLLISIDGFKWNYIEQASTPNFDKFIHGGVRSAGLIPSLYAPLPACQKRLNPPANIDPSTNTPIRASSCGSSLSASIYLTKSA